MRMQYVYGPMLSRRLGQSLGVDLIPLKTCNWNCVYCQLGRTVPLSNERKDFFPPEDILKVADAIRLKKCKERITFSSPAFWGNMMSLVWKKVD